LIFIKDSFVDEIFNGDIFADLYVRNVTKDYELWQSDALQRSAGAFGGEGYYELFDGRVCTDSPYYWADLFETDDYGQIGIWFSYEGLYVKHVYPVPEPVTLLLVWQESRVSERK
jgi:hypothetical protein